MKRFFKVFIGFFSSITTSIVAIMSVVCALENFAWQLSPYILVQILLSGAVTALTTTPFEFITVTESKVRLVLLSLLQYVLLCGEMMLFGWLFGWFGPSEIWQMPIYVAAVYVLVVIIMYIATKREADELTRAIIKNNRAKAEEKITENKKRRDAL
ncbi:MAG: DUF3021 family protein [Clostridia bacterium]|nr:DUF3021 family protein [Clostridia bacterium]